MILINNKEVDQYNRETKLNRSLSQANIRRTLIQVEKIPHWMDINTASQFIKYAVATYSWKYYLYMHNMRGFCDICCICSPSDGTDGAEASCCSCCTCFKRKSVVTDAPDPDELAQSVRKCTVHGDNKTKRNLRAFKFLSKTEECDIVYANFTNELFLSPFVVLIDHHKKAVVITIRGTLSMR